MKRWILVSTLSILGPILILALLEGAFRGLKLLKNRNSKPYKIWQEKVLQKEQKGDLKFFKIQAEKEENLIWKYNAYFNEKTKQRLPYPANPSMEGSFKEKHFLTLGGSFPFGVNLNYEDTIAGQVEKEIPTVESLNFAIPGGGPHETLKVLDNVETRKVISSAPKEGVTLYIIIDDHIGRTIMDVAHISDMSDRPHYELINGDFKYRGLYSEVHPIQSKTLNLLSKSELLRYLGFNPPIGDKLNLSNQHLMQFCSIIEGIKKKVEELKPQTLFYVLFYPSAHLSYKLFHHCFDAKSIQYLNYSLSLQDNLDEAFFKDFHPRAMANKFVAKKVIEDIPMKQK